VGVLSAVNDFGMCGGYRVVPVWWNFLWFAGLGCVDRLYYVTFVYMVHLLNDDDRHHHILVAGSAMLRKGIEDWFLVMLPPSRP
jgi:hypothetical protein